MSDSETLGGGIIGGLIGYGAGRKKGFSEGYQQAKSEDEWEIARLRIEVSQLQNQIRELQSKKA